METGKHIHHKMCGHGGERMVTVWVLNDKDEKEPAYFLIDGYEPETNTVYQFHGCHWHGHTSGADAEILKRRGGGEGAPCWGPCLASENILGLRWSKKAEITLETIIFWQNTSICIFKVSPFLSIKSYQFFKIY